VALGAVGVGLGVPLALSLIVAALLLSGITHVYRVPNAAMEPMLRSRGDRVVAVKYLFFGPGRSDVVAFRPPARAGALCGTRGVLVERIVGLPGETWQEQKGRVYIGGELLREPYIVAGRSNDSTQKPVRIPKGSFFVLGDNRSASCDSRRWGPLPRADIIGRVIATYWPPSRMGLH